VEHCDIALREAARIINVMCERGISAADEAAILDWSDATAARGDRRPQPNVGLQFLRELGLVSAGDAGSLALDACVAPDGGQPALYIDRLPQDTTRWVFVRMMRHAEIRQEIDRVLKFCVIEEGQARVCWGSLSPEIRASPAWLWLQRVDTAVQAADGLILGHELLPHVAEIREPALPLSQEALDTRLALRRERAMMAEEYVVRFERDRLTRAGAPHLAAAVEQISLSDVCAGYDVQSFEISGRPRLIEVKSCAGPRNRFYLSDNERRVAEANEDGYWLAWVGWAVELPDGEPEILWVKDLNAALAREPSPWRVSSFSTVVDCEGDDASLQTPP